MFPIGDIKDKKRAQDLSHFLSSKKIANQLTFNPSTQKYLLLVEKEQDIPQALDYFKTAIGIPKSIEPDPHWMKIHALPDTPLTLTLIGTSVVLYIVSLFSEGKLLLNILFFSQKPNFFIPEIKNGQIWRIWSPIFLHFGLLHLVFNMFWLRDLGRVFENSKSKIEFILFVLITASLSNIAQYLTQGPSFGGMSGVVFGLLGVVWMEKTLNQKFPYGLPKADVILMSIWFALCTFDLIPNIANSAHAVGLSLGMLLGIIKGSQNAQKDISKILAYTLLSLAITLLTFAVEYLKHGKSLYFYKFF
jgi:GlpG protein